MNNISSEYQFSWSHLGDIELARPNIGPELPVAVYRLMEYTMRHVLAARYGNDEARDILRESGMLAGEQFCRHLLDASLSITEFLAQLQKKLKELRIGILRVEEADFETLEMVVTVSEDLDCSGLPVMGVAVCDYDEGFIAGIFKSYTGKDMWVKEIDCWATGERTCRFRIRPLS